MGFIVRHSKDGDNHLYSNVLRDSCDEMVVSALSTPFIGKHIVIGFCDGTFLVKYVNSHVFVWDPLSQCKILPPLPIMKFPPGSNFDFDCDKTCRVLPPPPTMKSPSCSNSDCDKTCRVKVVSHFCGMGIVPYSGDYKVLRITSNYYYHPDGRVCLKQAQVYSVTNNCWEEIEIDSDEYKYDMIGFSIYIGGVCYWMAKNVDGGRVIASFSFTTQKFSIFDVPPIILDESFEYDRDLVEIERTLGIVVYPVHGNVKRFSFLVLREGSWVRKTEYDVRLVGAKSFLRLSYNNMLLLEGRDGELLVYDYKKKKLNRIDQIYNYPLEMSVFPYAEITTPHPDGNIAASKWEKRRPSLVPTLGGEGSESTVC